MTPERVGGSFRDPSGFLYRRDGVLLRQIEPEYREAYDMLLASDLYDELISHELLIPHEEASNDLAFRPGAYRVLRPELVKFISYPYSWCFSELRDAALTTLEIQRRALARGMILKDASAYNIQFHKTRPVLIDTLSFEPYREGDTWQAYRQFCQHFLAPLLLMSRSDIRLQGLLLAHIDGIPLDLASRLLPRRTYLSFSTLLHVHMHARMIRRHADDRRSVARARPMSKAGLLGLIDSLESAVRSTSWRPSGTEWAEYESEHNYGERGMVEKQRIVRELLCSLRPSTVWDLGANTGTFSRIAAETGADVVAFDVDPAAVERAYLRMRSEGETRILPLLADLSNPSPALGWAHSERLSLVSRGPADVVLALALVHHLAISNNVPLGDIASFLATIGHRLIIEFVPKTDPQAQRLLTSRRDIFTSYDEASFEREFGRLFHVERSEGIEGTSRRIYSMVRR